MCVCVMYVQIETNINSYSTRKLFHYKHSYSVTRI